MRFPRPKSLGRNTPQSVYPCRLTRMRGLRIRARFVWKRLVDIAGLKVLKEAALKYVGAMEGRGWVAGQTLQL